jgi:hypothetical protein
MKRRIEEKQLGSFEKVVKRKMVWGNTRQLLVNFTVGSLRRSSEEVSEPEHLNRYGMIN